MDGQGELANHREEERQSLGTDHNSAGTDHNAAVAWGASGSCPGKLNLFLEVGARRSDGYHELETVMALVSLADRLWFRRRDDDRLQLVMRSRPEFALSGFPAERDNLVWRILDGFRQAAGVHCGADLLLEKCVPMQAGLGGASSDAATALSLANREWEVGWSEAELSSFAAGYGSDIPFFLAGGWAVCRGRGEIVTRLSGGIHCPVVLVQPPVGFSTAEIYQRHQPPENLRTAESMVLAIQAGRTREVGRELFNRLEAAASGMGPWLPKLREAVRPLPVIGQQMTGSGSCYFGMFPNKQVARGAARRLQAALPECRVILSELLPG